MDRGKNILGDPFADYVKNQIEIRQKKLGIYNNRSNDDLKYYASKTPWIRLASSVDVNGKALDDLNTLGLDTNSFSNDNLAKKLILFGGSTNLQGEIKSGISSPSTSDFNGAYGWGRITGKDNRDRGYVPLPGIEGVNVTYQNNGALAKVNIKIRCYSKTQLLLIDYLYLRPGYTLLLEFGWSVYFDNNGNLESNKLWDTEPFKKLFAGYVFNSPSVLIGSTASSPTTQYDIYDAINKEKENQNGNYEAFFGKISNFKWNFNSDGSYSCEITLITLGDVIESLKLNLPNIEEGDITTKEEEKYKSIESYQNFSKLNQILYNIYKEYSTKGDLTINNYTYTRHLTDEGTYIDKTFEDSIFTILGATVEKGDFNDEEKNQVYIKLGVFLDIIQSEFLLYDNQNGKTTPLFKFDHNFEELNQDESYFLTFPGHFSADPTICIIPFSSNFNVVSTSLIVPDSEIRTPYGKLWKSNIIEGSLYRGKLMNVLVNVNYLAGLLGTIARDEEGKVTLLSFLQEVLDQINEALGNINSFSIETQSNGLVRILSKIPEVFLDKEDKFDKYTRFNLFGVKKDEGNFIRNLSLDSEISSNFSTMISVGAQAGGNKLSSNATSFSSYNAGLIDRIVKEKSSPKPQQFQLLPGVSIDVGNPTETLEEEPTVEQQIISLWNGFSISEINENNKKIATANSLVPFEDQTTYTSTTQTSSNNKNSIVNYLKLIYSDDNDKEFISDHIDTLKTKNTSFCKLMVGLLSSEKKKLIQSPFFLPFNLKLTIDGLGGMVLYQGFKISDDVLPLVYKEEEIVIIIKGINHTVDTNGWITEIETMTSPRTKISSSSSNVNTSRSNSSTTQSGGVGPKENIPFQENLPIILPVPQTDKMKKAMEAAYAFNVKNYGEAKSECGKYVFNYANNYIKKLKNINATLDPKMSEGGRNANSDNFSRDIINLGYMKQRILTNGSKQKLIQTINSMKFGYGDIIIYSANDTSVEIGNHTSYGHAQIWVSKDITANIGKKIGTGFASSDFNNYGISFVYNRKSNNKWDLTVFRAPSTV